jgi:hypothetical protein
MILKRIAQAAETISQQPAIFERTSQFLLRRISCVSRSIVGHLNIWSQLVTTYNFFQNTSLVYFISNLSQTHSDDL